MRGFLFICKSFDKQLECNKQFSSKSRLPFVAIVSGYLPVASWLVRSSLDRAVRVRALAGDIVLCSWARHFNLTVPLQVCVKMVTCERNAGFNPAMD